jgi:hypothetical protein
MITIRELCQLHGVSRRSVMNHLKKGTLKPLTKASQEAGHYLFARDAARAWAATLKPLKYLQEEPPVQEWDKLINGKRWTADDFRKNANASMGDRLMLGPNHTFGYLSAEEREAEFQRVWPLVQKLSRTGILIRFGEFPPSDSSAKDAWLEGKVKSGILRHSFFNLDDEKLDQDQKYTNLAKMGAVIKAHYPTPEEELADMIERNRKLSLMEANSVQGVHKKEEGQ